MFKWQRRDKKLESRKNRIRKHGHNLAIIYKNVILKRKKELERN